MKRRCGLLPGGDFGYAFRVIARATPSLRLARFFVQGFRTFREKTEIPLSDVGGPADEIATFHGPNGSGKSNALAALELFFRGAAMWLASGANPANQAPNQLSQLPLQRLRMPWGWADHLSGFELTHRNWPAGERDTQSVVVAFADRRLAPMGFSLQPVGNESFIDLQWFVEPSGAAVDPVVDTTSLEISAQVERAQRLAAALLAPQGPRSTPFFRLGARRSHLQSIGGTLEAGAPADSPLSVAMATRLYDFATSVEPEDTERWRAFGDLVHKFQTLDRRELSIVLTSPSGSKSGSSFDLRFEIRGKQILRLSELSSGEQQIIALCAAVLTSRAAIVAIEEPEISLHPDYQAILRDILADQVKAGILDQVILESHSPTFDSGPKVVHFSRSEDEIPVTRVTRIPSIEASPAVRDAARAAGARRHWVSSEGYTQLPPEMCAKLGLDRTGGHVWFLPDDSGPAWKAWKEEDLDAVFGDRTGRREE